MRVPTCVRARRSSCTFLDRDPAISRIGFAVPAGAHAISSAETIGKWVNRSNVLPAALRLNGAAFSSLAYGAQRLFRWNSNAPRASRFFLSLSLLALGSSFLAYSLPCARLSFLIAPVIPEKTDRHGFHFNVSRIM